MWKNINDEMISMTTGHVEYVLIGSCRGDQFQSRQASSVPMGALASSMVTGVLRSGISSVHFFSFPEFFPKRIGACPTTTVKSYGPSLILHLRRRQELRVHHPHHSVVRCFVFSTRVARVGLPLSLLPFFAARSSVSRSLQPTYRSRQLLRDFLWPFQQPQCLHVVAGDLSFSGSRPPFFFFFDDLAPFSLKIVSSLFHVAVAT